MNMSLRLLCLSLFVTACLCLPDACQAQATFTNVATQLLPVGHFDAGTGQAYAGSAASWGDYNNDGYVDLLVGDNPSATLFMNNSGTGFTAPFDRYSHGCGIWGDVNNDLFLDVAAYRWSTHSPTAAIQPAIILADSGTNFFGRIVDFGATHTFLDPAYYLPIPPQTAPFVDLETGGICFADLNNDGFLDLYIGGEETGASGVGLPDQMLFNNGDGTFTNVWTGGGRVARGVTACDFDEDGDQDIYVSNYRLQPNYLWQNDGAGGFTDVATAYGALGGNGHSIGSCWGDFDNDGHFDLFAGNFAHLGQPESRFLENHGGTPDYKFTDKGNGGVTWQESYATPTLGDYDNDGYLDLYFTTVYPADAPRLYRNNGNWTFTDVSAAAGLSGLGQTWQAAWADWDNDGDLDLMTDRGLFRNDASSNGNHWLNIRVQGNGTTVNRAAIGTQVRITVPGLGTLTRQVEGGTGAANQNDLRLHFGLGGRTAPVDLEVTWPNGVTQTISGVAVDRFVELGVGPLVDNGVGATGITHEAACLTGDRIFSADVSAADVCVYWGETTNWTGQQCLSGFGTGPFSMCVTGLSHNTAYAYRCYVTNAFGDDWADDIVWFTTAGVLPFGETFEALTAGSIDLQHGWVSEPSTSALVQTSETYAGSGKAVSFGSGMLCHAFSSQVSTNIVWTDFYAKLVFRVYPPAVAVSNATAVWYVEKDTGYIVAYDGTTRTALTSQPSVSTSEWARFTVRSDYANGLWDLWLNGTNVAQSLSFYSPTPSTFTGMWIADEGLVRREAFFDNLNISLTMPSGLLAIIDDAFDSWIDAFSLAAEDKDPGDDPDMDGATNFEEWVAGTDPNDPDSVFHVVVAAFQDGSNCIMWVHSDVDSVFSNAFIVYRSTNLVDAMAWNVVASNLARNPSGTNTWYDASPPAVPAFYRPVLPTDAP